MDHVELLTVEDSFHISGRGLVLIPDFSIPNVWKDRTERTVIAKPDGSQVEATAQFTMTHFNISDPKVSPDKRWRLVVLLPDCEKGEVPVGSRILVSPMVRYAVIGESGG